MAAGDELRDPWGWVLAAVAGGLGWAVVGGPLGIAAGVVIAAVVLAVKVAVGSSRAPQRPAVESVRPDALPQPAQSSPAGQLLRRADAAVARIAQLSEAPGDPWLRDQVGQVDDESTEALASLRELGGRITLVEQSMLANDPRRLLQERSRLAAAAAAATDPRLAAEQQRALQAVDQQLEVAGRLDTLRQTLLARMETAVLGLEGLAARMGEVVALGPTAVDHDRAQELIGGLTVELDTLRGGIAEAQELAAPLPPAAPPAPPQQLPPATA